VRTSFDQDFDDCCDDGVDEEDAELIDFGFFPFFFAVEEIGVDCDAFDDDFDGLFDEGADCEVEIGFFGLD
jgi:hypothetical protein